MEMCRLFPEAMEGRGISQFEYGMLTRDVCSFSTFYPCFEHSKVHLELLSCSVLDLSVVYLVLSQMCGHWPQMSKSAFALYIVCVCVESGLGHNRGGGHNLKVHHLRCHST